MSLQETARVTFQVTFSTEAGEIPDDKKLEEILGRLFELPTEWDPDTGLEVIDGPYVLGRTGDLSNDDPLYFD